MIARAERSELSVSEFCRRETGSTASFYTWRNRLRRLGEPQSVPVPGGADFIDPGTLGERDDNTGPWLIELYQGAGVVLRLRQG